MLTPLRRMVDIHCHLIPNIDDGSTNLDESLAMARMAVADGIGTIICTPHQLGNFRENTGDRIRSATSQLQAILLDAGIPLRVLPGGDVRIEQDMLDGIAQGRVMTLADQHRHVLLELPHELYFPLEPILDSLRKQNLIGILSHPERNQGLLAAPELLPSLVQAGCLMQVTAGSILGTMGAACQQLAHQMLQQRLVHFVASDAHGSKTRRPRLYEAFLEVARLTDETTAQNLFVCNPACVAIGKDVPSRPLIPRTSTEPKQRRGWFGNKKAS